MQQYFGSADDFFDFRFVTDKNPNDLAEFYGSEDFMEIFCIFPFVVEFMMKQGEFASDALPGFEQTVNTFGLSGPGKMEVSMAFDEQEVDTTGDGEPDTVAYFNKRERFKDWAPFLPKYMNVVFWDLTQNFGYHRRSDGTCEVYHHGETFYGPFPIRIIFTLHAKYVAWATERYINRPEFGNAEKLEEQEALRKNIPADVFNDFLATLTANVEKARAEAAAKQLNVSKHEETLAKLQEAAKNRKLKSTMTVYQMEGHASKVQVQVDNAAAQDAIRAALAHIGETEGKSDAPAAALEELLKASEILLAEMKLKEALGAESVKRKIMRRQSTLAVAASQSSSM